MHEAQNAVTFMHQLQHDYLLFPKATFRKLTGNIGVSAAEALFPASESAAPGSAKAAM